MISFYSFITGGKTRTTADADLWKKHKETNEAYEEGTDEYTEYVKKKTPCQKKK